MVTMITPERQNPYVTGDNRLLILANSAEFMMLQVEPHQDDGTCKGSFTDPTAHRLQENVNAAVAVDKGGPKINLVVSNTRKQQEASGTRQKGGIRLTQVRRQARSKCGRKMTRKVIRLTEIRRQARKMELS